MSDFNPIRQILQNLVNEFQAVNTICLHFNVHLNALIEERTKVENNRLIRRCCRCLRFVDALKPETSTFYKDKSFYVLGMLRDVGVQYDDLKQRYFWALDRLAEVTMKLERLRNQQLEKEARDKRLGKGWKDFGKHHKEKIDSSGKIKGIEDIDKLLGLMLLETRKKGQAENNGMSASQKQRGNGKLCTKITKSSRLTKIEDIPQTDSCESGDPFKKKKGISQMLLKLRKPRKSSDHHKPEELANRSEIKMQMFTLMAEVAERDEIIDLLTSQMKIKDAQLAELSEIICREKLGFAINTNAQRQSESETTEKGIL